MANFLNFKLRRKVFKEAMQIHLQLTMILLKCYWGYFYPGTNCRLYFNNMQLNMRQNGMPVPRYGALLSQHFHHIIATLHRIWNSFGSQKMTFELMLHSAMQ